MSGYYSIQANSENGSRKIAFEHQNNAFKEMSKIFTFPINSYKGTMVVLPTGGGKTFTAVRWLCNNVLSKNIKILWLAQSTYLLDQAFKTFSEEIKFIPDREIINVRVVSGNENHANVGTVSLSDDVIICTTQTAILNYKYTSLDLYGEEQKKPLGKYIDKYKNGELLIVIDEAHHTPAFGCRTMLTDISENMNSNLYVLGLTATPFHNDQRISGWLQKIYNCGEDGVSFKISTEELQAKNILAVPKYIQKDTNIKVAVDDKTFKRLQKDHKDVPEDIIDELAANNDRNTLIANDYIQNKNKYGKTIIFADRWIQCESIVSKLNNNGIKADAVYSKVENGNLSGNDNSGRTRNELNKIAMDNFRANKLDVIVNVKMLTEGVDVPDVKTVMLTRQTTSPILFTQMVGRALRGKGAGGGEDKYDANVVLFVDEWERFIDFKSTVGDFEEIESAKSEIRLSDLVSIDLVKRACEDLPFDELMQSSVYLSLIPIGWYSAEYTKVINNENGEEETKSINEAIPVYDKNAQHFSDFINGVNISDFSECENESISDEILNSYAKNYYNEFFDAHDNIGDNLITNISSLLRHMAQNHSKPDFVDFGAREYHDLSKIAKENISLSKIEIKILCKKLFDNESRMWKTLYKNFHNFYNAFNREADIIILKDEDSADDIIAVETEPTIDWDSLREQVLKRDNYTCKCCGKQKGRGVQLNADHILPHNMGGKSVIDNLQTLCKECNLLKNVDIIDYNITKSNLLSPLPLKSILSTKSDLIENYLARVINSIYHCKAFCSLKYSARSNGINYRNWEITLYSGNNLEWALSYKNEIIKYINENFFLGTDRCHDIIIK